MSDWEMPVEEPDLGEYCRRVEMHLAQVNRGHVVRVVGPAFELVRTWAVRGVPLNVVRRGIDRKAERHARGTSTRALRLEFCEPDVEAEFSAWKRAVGLTSLVTAGGGSAEEATSEPVATTEDLEPAPRGKGKGLSRAIDRAIDRLAAAGGRLDTSEAFRGGTSAALERLVDIKGRLAKARGAARIELGAELGALHQSLVGLAHQTGGPVVDDVTKDASAEMQPYRFRLGPEVWQRSVDATRDRLLLDRLGLPWLADLADLG